MSKTENILKKYRQWRCRHKSVSRLNWVERDEHGPELWSRATCDDCGKRLSDETSIFDFDETSRHLAYARGLPIGKKMEIRRNKHGQYYSPLT